MVAARATLKFCTAKKDLAAIMRLVLSIQLPTADPSNITLAAKTRPYTAVS